MSCCNPQNYTFCCRLLLALRQHGRADRHRAGSGDFVCYGHRPDLPGAGAELARRPACLSADTAQAGAGLPRSLPIIDGLLTLFFVGGTRFPVCVRTGRSVRAAEYWQARTSNRTQRKRVLIAASSSRRIPGRCGVLAGGRGMPERCLP